jgi:hypothetical protein
MLSGTHQTLGNVLSDMTSDNRALAAGRTGSTCVNRRYIGHYIILSDVNCAVSDAPKKAIVRVANGSLRHGASIYVLADLGSSSWTFSSVIHSCELSQISLTHLLH